MNSKGHLYISFAKSIIRVFGGIVAFTTNTIKPLAISIVMAEIGGILEELVDQR